MKKSYDKIINNHYNKVATNLKKSKLSIMNNIFVRNEKTKFIINLVKNSKKINFFVITRYCGLVPYYN